MGGLCPSGDKDQKALQQESVATPMEEPSPEPPAAAKNEYGSAEEDEKNKTSSVDEPLDDILARLSTGAIAPLTLTAQNENESIPTDRESARQFMEDYMENLEGTVRNQGVLTASIDLAQRDPHLARKNEMFLHVATSNVGDDRDVHEGLLDGMKNHFSRKLKAEADGNEEEKVDAADNADEELIQELKAEKDERPPLDPKSGGLMMLFNNRTLEDRIPFSSLPAGGPVAPESYEDLMRIMQEAADNGLRIKASGTEYAWDNVAYTDGCLINMKKHLNNGVCKDLMQADVAALKSEFKEMYEDNSYIICEAGASIQDVNFITWPFSEGKNGIARYNRTNPETGKPYKQMKTMTGYHGLCIGGLVSVGAHGFGRLSPAMQNMVLSLRILTFDANKKLRQVQVEPSNGIHDAAAWSAVYPGVELIQNDETFNAVVVCAGTCGVIYSLTLELEDAHNLYQKRILTTWSSFKKEYEKLRAKEASGKIEQLEYYLTPYSLLGAKKDAPVMIKLNIPAEEEITGPVDKSKTRMVFASLQSVVSSAFLSVMASHYTEALLPGMLYIGIAAISYTDKLLMSSPDACQLGSLGSVPVMTTSMIVEQDQVLGAVDEWIKVMNEKDGMVFKHPCTSPVGVTTCNSAAGYIGMGSGRATSWLEMPLPYFTNYHKKRNFYEGPIPKPKDPKKWQEGADKVYEKLMAEPYNGRFHLACYSKFTKEVWLDKRFYPDIDKFIKVYKEFNVSQLFRNKFTAEGGLDKIAGFE